MDFMKILKSLEEALYEVMVWLVFYPLTFWKVLTRPGEMMAYADSELSDKGEDRYSDRLSPPIFLAITLGISHALELAVGYNVIDKGIFADDTNLLALRMVLYSAYPLVLSVRLLRKQGIPLDRRALKPPFYAQCYVAAPWAMVVGWAPQIAYAAKGANDERAAMFAVLAIVLAGVWYMTLQARWFARELGVSRWSGLRNALWTFFEATVIVVTINIAVSQL